MWVIVINLIKISILDLYISIFRNKFFVRVCHVALGLSTLALVAFTIVKFTICHPLEYNWDMQTVQGSCGSENSMYLAVVSTDLVLDIVIIILPMPVLWGLQMKTAKKIAIMLTFGLGGM